MLRFAFALVAMLGMVAVSTAADDKKPIGKGKDVKLEGKITCAKCDLGEGDKCATVIKVKDTVYFFDTAAHKKYHADTCNEAKDGTVEGTVSEKDGKKVITVKKLSYK